MVVRGSPIGLEELERVAYGGEEVSLEAAAIEKMARSRAIVERIVSEGRVVYGVNTGFGKLSDVHVPPDQLRELQLNLVRSHCCGLGTPLSEPEVRAVEVYSSNNTPLQFQAPGMTSCATIVVWTNRYVNRRIKK